jgi:hypothetical protein
MPVPPGIEPMSFIQEMPGWSTFASARRVLEATWLMQGVLFPYLGGDGRVTTGPGRVELWCPLDPATGQTIQQVLSAELTLVPFVGTPRLGFSLHKLGSGPVRPFYVVLPRGPSEAQRRTKEFVLIDTDGNTSYVDKKVAAGVIVSKALAVLLDELHGAPSTR